MKKNSIIAIIIIFLLSFMAVGFLGMEMEIYDPVKYVNEIEWDSKELEKDSQCKIFKYEKGEKEYDARMVYRSLKPLTSGVKFNIKTHANPLDATTTALSYYMDENDSQYKYVVKGDNTVDVTFYSNGPATLMISSTDGSNISYIISFIILDKS